MSASFGISNGSQSVTFSTQYNTGTVSITTQGTLPTVFVSGTTGRAHNWNTISTPIYLYEPSEDLVKKWKLEYQRSWFRDVEQRLPSRTVLKTKMRHCGTRRLSQPSKCR